MIPELQAGPELDARIAQEVMRLTRLDDCPLGDATCGGRYNAAHWHTPCLPPYSTNIAAALQILARFDTWELEHNYRYSDVRTYRCSIWTMDRDGDASGRTAALAICESALSMVIPLVAL